MILSKNRILKASIAFILAVGAMFIMYYRPWYPGFSIHLSGPTLVTLEKSNGSITEIKLEPGEKDLFSFFSTKLISAKDMNGNPVQVHPAFHLGHSETLRFMPHIRESVIIVSVLLFLFFWMMLENFRREKYQKKYLISMVLNLCLVTFAFVLSYPGNFGYDSFDNFRAISSFTNSQFIGDVYFSIIAILYQFVPEPWIISFFNLAVIFLCLNGLAGLSIKWNKWWAYFLAVILFFAYPVNLPMSAYSVRDISASWLFAYLLIDLYDLFLSQELNFSRNVKILFLMVMTSCLRQEALYLLPPALILISFFSFKKFLVPSVLISALTMGLVLMTKIVDDPPRVNSIYKTTLYVNPLSYILKNKYPDGLPDDVDKKLGPFFNNDYLIKYQDDYEINPFHKGGLNYEFKDEDFVQFKTAARDIFLENPGLLLENRLKMASYMLGFKKDFNYTYSDEYFSAEHDTPDFFHLVKQQLAFSDYSRPIWAMELSEHINDFNYVNRPLTNSYLFVLVVLAFSMIYNRKSSIYLSILAVVLVRTLLVIALAPAGYFKYLYPLMIFVPFALPILLADQRLKIDKSASSV